jgi:hypothetical protein
MAKALAAVGSLPTDTLLGRHAVVLGVAVVVDFFPVAALVAGHLVVAVEAVVLVAVKAVVGAAVVAVLSFPAGPLPVGYAVVFSIAIVKVTVTRALSKTGTIVVMVAVGERSSEGASSRKKYGSESSKEGSFHGNSCAVTLNRQVAAVVERRLPLLELAYANPRPKMAPTQKLRAYADQIPTNSPHFQT